MPGRTKDSRQTDHFLDEWHDLRVHNERGRRFSMIYFSDHGMAHRDIDRIPDSDDFGLSKQSWRVGDPAIDTSDDLIR